MLKTICRVLFSQKDVQVRDPHKILLLKTGAMGDILMCTPFIRALRKKFPDAIIDFRVGSWSAEILKGNPHLNKVIPFDETIMLKKKIKPLLNLKKEIQDENYDTLIILDRSYLINCFGKLTKIPQRIGFDREGEGFSLTSKVNSSWNNHHIKEYLKLLEPFGIKENSIEIEVFPTEQNKQKINDFMKDKKAKTMIAIAPLGAKNPGEVALKRRWLPYNYKLLMNHLCKNKNAHLFLLGGKDEHFELEKFTGDQVFNASGFSVIESIELLRKMDLLITHDSGPMHMGAAANIPVLSLFGPTNPNEKAPLTKGSKVIWKNKHLIKEGKTGDYLSDEGMEKITVEEVYAAAVKMVQ